MRTNSLIMFGLAIVFGALAVFVANQWMNSRQGGEIVIANAPQPAMKATIVVAANSLRFGKPLQRLDLKEIAWDGMNIPEGAFKTIDEVFANNSRRVVLSAIETNEPVLKTKISGPDSRASLSAVITEGMRAASIRVNDVVGVGGFVLPGDRVDILFTRNDRDDTRGSDVLIQNVRVLAVDQLADETTTAPAIGKTVTVEVTTEDAQKLALAGQVGSLSLSLRAAGSLDAAAARKIVVEELTSSPSVYQTEFNAREAAQAAINSRLNKFENTISQLNKELQSTGKGGEDLKKQLASLESNLKQSADEADKGKAELKARIASLEANLKQAYSDAGQGDAALRSKIAEVEANLRSVLDKAKQGDPSLRQKLAALEASLRQLSKKPSIPIEVIPAGITVENTGSQTIQIYRAMKTETYEVPREVAEGMSEAIQ